MQKTVKNVEIANISRTAFDVNGVSVVPICIKGNIVFTTNNIPRQNTNLLCQSILRIHLINYMMIYLHLSMDIKIIESQGTIFTIHKMLSSAMMYRSAKI